MKPGNEAVFYVITPTPNTCPYAMAEKLQGPGVEIYPETRSRFRHVCLVATARGKKRVEGYIENHSGDFDRRVAFVRRLQANGVSTQTFD